MPPKAVRLADFLGQINVSREHGLPWTHTTEAANIFSILEDGKITAIPCQIFRDKLCYFFVGRPAYKTASEESPEFWQLPITFVFRFPSAPPIKRVFPFDSGAFKNGRLPTYVTTFRLGNFEITSDAENIGRLISFFFETPKRYLSRRAVGHEEIKEKFSLDARHQEILALSKLYLENSSADCDDRAAAVEIQVEGDIALKRDSLLGIVIPAEYARAPDMMASLKAMTPHVETYDLLPLNSSAHHALVYEAVNRIYKKHGIGL